MKSRQDPVVVLLVAVLLLVIGVGLFRGVGNEVTPEKVGPRVVVVGAGLSGLSAALELAEGGAEVTVVDMSSVYGGHAVMSQGGLSIIGTPVQEAEGLQDTPELAFKDFIEWGEGADREWVRYYVDHSRTEIHDWLIDLGVEFTGVESSPGNSVKRFHQPAGRGIGLVTPVYRACLERDNVEFVWNTRADSLLIEDQRVIGVRVTELREGGARRLEADAVVLATGGFQSNLAMVREFWPSEFKFPGKILAGSGRHSVGLGHRMAERVGGDLVKMDYQWNYYSGLPDPQNPGSNKGLNAANMWGILVNWQGRRFANDHGWAKDVMPALLSQEQVTCWTIFDEATKKEFSVSGSDWADAEKVDRLVLQNPELVKQADTIEELARLSGLPSRNLVETVARYNAMIERGVDEDFGRFGPGKSEFNNKASVKIQTPPYYAMKTYPLTRKSMGGVAIDLKCRVVDKRKRPIPGLFAVGELTGLALINGKAALEGTFLGPCVVTGRVAARSILAASGWKRSAGLVAEQRCIDCHDVAEEIVESRPGFWHFERVHSKVLEQKIDCRQCHGELSPYREDDHRINPRVLTAACMRCHTGRE
ncbi:MAG: hypothetical protein CMJ65_12710 [Planctomycetaceae bacterium]|nr:hypothetical protein [Planctomycetaceae bacterium]